MYVKNLYEELQKSSEVSVTFTTIEQMTAETSLVHMPYFDPFFLTLPTLTLPFIVTIHDLIPLKFPKHFPKGVRGSVKWYVQRYRARQASAILTDSLVSKNDITTLMSIDSQKIYPVHLAAHQVFEKIGDSKQKEKIRQKYNLPQKFVLYVGDVNWNKNVPGLISSIEKLNIPLVMVSQTLKNTVNGDHPVQKGIRLLQESIAGNKNFLVYDQIPQNDLVMFYNLATLMVLPSYYEGFGLPIVEAFACACPVVCSTEGSLPEVAGGAARLINPYDIGELTKAIDQMYSSVVLQNEYSKKGLLRAKGFSWEKTAIQTIDVYKKVLKK